MMGEKPRTTVFQLPIINRPPGVVSIPRIPSADDFKSIIANYESDRSEDIKVNLKEIQDSIMNNDDQDSKPPESNKKRNTKAQRKSTRKTVAQEETPKKTSSKKEGRAKKAPGRQTKTTRSTTRKGRAAKVEQPDEKTTEKANESNKETSVKASLDVEVATPRQRTTIKVDHSELSFADSKNEANVNVGVTRGQYALVSCDTYPSFSGQPFQIYFSFEVQILMHIHSYLSKNEVIGLLGGKCFETNQFVPGTREKIKIILVTKIYPAQSNI